MKCLKSTFYTKSFPIGHRIFYQINRNFPSTGIKPFAYHGATGGLVSGGGDGFIEANVIDFLDEGVHEMHRERSRTQKINEFPELKLNKCSTNGIWNCGLRLFKYIERCSHGVEIPSSFVRFLEILLPKKTKNKNKKKTRSKRIIKYGSVKRSGHNSQVTYVQIS